MRARKSGSVVEELAEDPAHIVQLRLKFKLMKAIIEHIDEGELTQVAAAEIMAVQRTRVNDVCKIVWSSSYGFDQRMKYQGTKRWSTNACRVQARWFQVFLLFKW